MKKTILLSLTLSLGLLVSTGAYASRASSSASASDASGSQEVSSLSTFLSSFKEASSTEGLALIRKLRTSQWPDMLPPCRLRTLRAQSFDMGIPSVPFGESGVYVLRFSMPKDRSLFLPERLEEEISQLDLTSTLRSTRADTKLIRSLYYLSLHTAKTTASKIHKRKPNQAEISKCLLPMEYIVSRLFYDEPAEGFLVIQEDRGQFYLRGITWYCPFSTWSKGFSWKEAGTSPSDFRTLRSLTRKVRRKDKLTYFLNTAELSILCASGCGKDLLDMIKYTVMRRGFDVLMCDAKETIMSFYRYCGFRPMAATASYLETDQSKSMTTKAYYHWLSKRSPVALESPAHLMMTRVTPDFRQPGNVLDRHPHCVRKTDGSRMRFRTLKVFCRRGKAKQPRKVTPTSITAVSIPGALNDDASSQKRNRSREGSNPPAEAMSTSAASSSSQTDQALKKRACLNDGIQSK